MIDHQPSREDLPGEVRRLRQRVAELERDAGGRSRSEQDRFRRAVESAPNAIVMIDRQGTIVLVNAQTERLFGYERHELLGQPVEILVPERFRARHPRDRSAFFGRPVSRKMGEGRELHGRRRDGSEFPVEIGLTPVETEEGLMVISAIVDITERRRADEKFRLAVESAPNAIVMINREGLIVLVNRQTERLFGYERQRLLGQPIEMLVPLRFRRGHVSNRDQFFQSPTTRAMGEGRDLYGLRSDGSEFPVEIGLTPIETNEGPVVLSAVVDISQRKAASEALTRSEEQFRVLAQTVPDIVFTADPSGLVEYLNPRWFELTGLSADDSKGAGWRCAVAPADAAAVAAAWQAAIATGEAMRLEARLRSTGGGERWHQIHGLPLRDGTGEIKQWVGTLADIDDLKRAEQELAIVAADLARSNRELENFAYVASHDLQEPLRTIAGHLQLIEKECRERLDSDAMVSIGFVIDGAKRMKTLINDLLTYSRVQTRSRELAPTDVGQLLSSVIGDLTVAIDESKAQVSFDPMPVVQADASQLEMTLRNLLANAIKFRGTQPPRIHIGVREADDEITFTVQDNGIGIEPQYWQRIFEIFQRLHTLDEYPGTGIGLAVCKCVVERHGGRIWVDSSPGRGSTFLFTIPRNPKARKHDVHRH